MRKAITARVSLHAFPTTQESIKTADEKEHHPYKYIHIHRPPWLPVGIPVGFSSWPSPTEAVGSRGALVPDPPTAHCKLHRGYVSFYFVRLVY